MTALPKTDARLADEHREKARELMRKIKICHVVTYGPGARMISRPMQMLECDEHDHLWFFTSLDSGKIRELDANPEVLLCFGDSDNHYVSVSGKAYLTRDPSRIATLWSEAARVWFPEGKNDPSLVAMRVEPIKAEYWDSAASIFVITYGYAKARLTGEIPKLGENETVQFH